MVTKTHVDPNPIAKFSESDKNNIHSKSQGFYLYGSSVKSRIHMDLGLRFHSFMFVIIFHERVR